MSLTRLCFAAALVLGTPVAEAQEGTPLLTGTFTIDIYNGFGGGTIESAGVQALATNPLITEGPLRSSVTYAGPLDFALQLPQGTPSTIKDFLDSGSGDYTGLSESAAALNLSSPDFADTTVFVVKFTRGSIKNWSIDHDDGIGLYLSDDLITPFDATKPASVTTTNLPSSDGGTFQLVYVAANGNPSILRVRGASQPDFADFGCRIDLKQTNVAGLDFVLPATGAEKFCPDTNSGMLKLDCSGQLPENVSVDAFSSSAIVCLISGSQCNLPGVYKADTQSITVSSSGFVQLSCTDNPPLNQQP